VQVEYDCVRTEWIEAQGYRLIRFTNGDVMQNLEGVLVMIGQVLDEMSLPTPNPVEPLGPVRGTGPSTRLREGNR
jgi:hypothetical protein